MTIALVTSTSTAQTGSGTTPGIDTTGADCIVLGITSASTVGYVNGHDSKNADGSWVNDGTTRVDTAAALYTKLNHILAPVVGSGHTFSGVTVWGPAGVVAGAFSGVDSLDAQTGVSNNASGTSHAASSGAMTPSQDGALVICIVGFGANPGTVTPPTGMTLLANCGPANNQGAHVFYEIQTTATARTPVATCTNSVTSAGATAIFLPTAAPAELSGNVTLDAVAPAGTFASSSSDVGGNVTLDTVAPAGTLGVAPGTVTVHALKNWSGSLQTSVTIPVVTVLSMATGAQVLALTDQATHATTADLEITDAALAAGTTYMVAGWNADGSQRFAVPLTAA